MNKIIKFKNAIITLLMTVICGVGASALTPWTVNPSDYRYDMSLYLKVALASDEMDYSLYDVGVFVGDECRGIAEHLPLGNGQECLYLRARSNQAVGETMTFRYYNKETEETLPVEGVSFQFESDSSLGYPSDPYIVRIIRHFDVAVSAGDGGTISSEGGRLAEGTELSIVATPDEGYHFVQWSDGTTDNPKMIVVDSDITLAAEFMVNTYTLTYTVDNEIYKEFDVDYGSSIVPEAFPEKEGHTFSGWEGLPKTMPSHDVTVTGSFTINSYTATFKIGDEVIESKEVVFGQPVVSPDAPVKEGYTFNGWDNVPETMPSHDIEITGSYTVNSYKLTYIVDGNNYKELSIDYGSSIVPEAFPEKDGHTFSGWEGLPETMPSHDVTVTGSFTINSYTATFKIGDEVIESKEVVFGQPVVSPDAPVREGYTFNGWDNVPEMMPSHDLEITGSYTVNSYKLTYVIDGETYKELDVDFGSELVAETPEKEGHTFSGWEGLPETMPSHDVTVTGSFTINSYTATFKIGDEVIESKEVVFGQPVVSPDAPVKEGYTFNGWDNVPETMPSHDLEIIGSYTVNSYKLTYIVDGETYKELDVDFGSELVAETLEKEGHTFSGWEGLPETMPSHDVTVTGSFVINYYTLAVYLDDQLFYTEEVEYGATINIPEPEVPDDRKFDGWQENIPETMPAHDLEIHGTTSELNGITAIFADDSQTVTVYTYEGLLMFKDVLPSEISGHLNKGIYIVKSGETTAKIVVR